VKQPELLPWLEKRLGRTTCISAKTGEGVETLRALVNEYARGREGRHRVKIEVREGAAIAWLEGNSEIISKSLDDETLTYEVRCQDQALAALRSKTRDRERLVVETLEAAPPPPPKEPRKDLTTSSEDLDPLTSSSSGRLPAAGSGRLPAAGSGRLPTAADDDRHPLSRGISARHRNIHKHG
jgi:hypothetical protein